MNLENVITILDQLIQKTKEEKVVWEKTSKAKSYKTSLTKGTVTVEKNAGIMLAPASPGAVNKPYYLFNIFNDKGETIYSKSTTTNSLPLLKPSQLTILINKKVSNLFEVVDDANDSSLKDIINELNSL